MHACIEKNVLIFNAQIIQYQPIQVIKFHNLYMHKTKVFIFN